MQFWSTQNWINLVNAFHREFCGGGNVRIIVSSLQPLPSLRAVVRAHFWRGELCFEPLFIPRSRVNVCSGPLVSGEQHNH